MAKKTKRGSEHVWVSYSREQKMQLRDAVHELMGETARAVDSALLSEAPLEVKAAEAMDFSAKSILVANFLVWLHEIDGFSEATGHDKSEIDNMYLLLASQMKEDPCKFLHTIMKAIYEEKRGE
jgi:hypothetical protein